jgi:hypothetical protein
MNNFEPKINEYFYDNRYEIFLQCIIDPSYYCSNCYYRKYTNICAIGDNPLHPLCTESHRTDRTSVIFVTIPNHIIHMLHFLHKSKSKN